MTSIFKDLETIPSQDPAVREEFMVDARENFKAPSGMNKDDFAKDLCITDPKEIKFTAKEKLQSMWEEAFRAEKCEEVGENNWLKTSFDGGKGEVITCVISDGEEYLTYKRDHQKPGSEAAMICAIFNGVIELCQGQAHTSDPYFVGHNIPFDLKFIFHRAVILGVEPPFSLPFSGRHGQHYFDNMVAWTGSPRPDGRISQNNLAAALGVPLKPDDIDGSKVWAHVRDGMTDRVAEYNVYDVETVVAIHGRLTFTGHAGLALPVDDIGDVGPDEIPPF